MNAKFKKLAARGFTLIELLIVVIIIAILAAVVVPQFNNTALEARESSLDANLAAMRSAIEVYRLQHKDVNPGVATAAPGTGTSCPSGSEGAGAAKSSDAFIAQLTMYTNAQGQACKVAATGFTYGPYLKNGFPADPIKDVATVITQDTGTAITVAATVDTGGWIYDFQSAQLVTNNGKKDTKGKEYYKH